MIGPVTLGYTLCQEGLVLNERFVLPGNWIKESFTEGVTSEPESEG